ncbi:MAG: O-antigen ligase family protein [Chloroflexota bacterium]|nr:O-antigen ligase family protein [Dehalococcoidia bacterium]MDW8253115.1 O-antigen ligase family protein [Chloroflexota bacterium]
MPTRFAAQLDRLLEASWLMVAIVVPLFFNVFSSRVFEPDKLTAFRGIMIFALAVWLLRELELPGAPGSLPRRWIAGFKANPLAGPVAILALSYVISTIFSVQPLVSIFGSYQRLQGTLNNFLYFALFFLVAAGLRDWGRLDRLITTFIIVSVPVSLYGMSQRLGLDPLPWGADVQSRVAGSAGNPIFLGAYLILVLPFLLARLVDVATRFRAGARDGRTIALLAAYSGALLVNLICLYWTGSRGPWMGFAASLVAMAFFLGVALRRRLLLLAPVAGVVAFVGVMAFLNSPLGAPLVEASAFAERLASIDDVTTGTNRVRMLIWFGDGVAKGAAGMVTDNLFRTIVGYGPETMYVAYNRFYPPTLAHYESRTATPDRSHNDLIDFLVTNGVIGLFAYLLIVTTFFSLAFRFVRDAPPGYRRLIAVAVVGAVVAHLVEALLGIPISSTRTHFWMIMGMATALPVLLAPAPAPAAAPTPAKPSSAAQARGRRRRPEGRPSPAPAPPPASPTWLAAAAWVVVTVVVVYLLLFQPRLVQGLVGQDSFPTLVVLGAFAWVWVGIVALATALPLPPSGTLTRTNRSLWMVAPSLAFLVILLAVSFANPIIADIRFKQAQSLDQIGRFDLSIPVYLKAIEAAPGEDFYHLFLGRAYLEAAKRAPEQGAAVVPRTMADLQRLASVAGVSRESLYYASKVALDQAYALSPLNTDHSANLGRLHRFWAEASPTPELRRQRLEESDRWYESALRLSPNAAHLWTEWGLTKEALGQPNEAVQKYEHAARLDNRYLPTFLQLGNLYLNQANAKLQEGDRDGAAPHLEAAKGYYQRVIELDPNQPIAHSALGFIYNAQGDTRAAIEANERAAAIVPNDLPTRRNLALLYRELALQTNDPSARAKAIEEARLAMSLAPDNERVALAQLIAELGGRP